ncbi:hypothetical protein BRC83_09210 [Halobacteriales archaeon QS_1_68_17]|nr:MAG: hypothetical protein BRC83_09210 [Halobacteriales archaeon QS_1_68_17]
MIENEAAGERRRGKVERLIAEYELEGIDEELIEYWTGDGRERRSLRELATYFNRQLLRAALDRNGAFSFDVDVETIHERLRDDATSAGVRTRIRRRLEREGVDVASLEADFVSHSAIRTFFGHRDVTPATDETDQVATESERIQKLRDRTAAVTADKLETLRSTDRIHVGDFHVLVDVQVFCEDCKTQLGIEELLEDRRCSC